MKFVRALFLLIIVFLLISSNLYSQTEQLHKVLKSNFQDTFPSLEKGIDKSVFENHSSKILKTATFDSTFVVDSVIVRSYQYRTQKESYTYNSDGNISSCLHEYWEGSKWVYSWRESYIYDSKGNMTSRLYENWNSTKWVNSSKRTYTYDSNENLTLTLTEWWEESQWVYYSKQTNTYDSDENWTSQLYEDRNSNQRRFTYAYDSNGNWSSLLYERFDGSQWVNRVKYTNTYDPNENLTLTLAEWWEESQWMYKSRITYTYDSKNNMKLELWKRWEGSQWVNSWQYTYTYDFNDNMALYFKENWDGSQWMSEWRRNYTYNSTGNMTLDLLEIWAEGQWVNDKRYIYTYDSNENMPLALAESWDGSSWVQNKMGELSFYDSFGREYNYLAYEANVYYSVITDVKKTHLDVLNYSLFQNYPNPFNPSTTIKYSIPNGGNENFRSLQLKIYDVLGREVATLVNKEQSPGNYEVQFNASSLTSGIYFYKLQAVPSSGSGQVFVESRKMILIK